MFALSSVLKSDFSDIIGRCKEVLVNFGPKDFIEIVILSVLLFFAVRLVRGKKAGALIMGITVLVTMLVASAFFKFNVLYRFFNAILGNGIIVLIIIFQPEIREALEKIGSGSIKGIMSFSDRRKKKEQYMNAIDNICSAVAEMSSECTGALIVIERSIRLSDVIKMGVVIDANVNDMLIRNLFYNKSPLHDGAIVISGEKIVAAACFLPLTDRIDLDSNLGTRHRAAIGMAEKSDAIVIVVSEETGHISIANDFTFIRKVTPDKLKEYLLENLLRISCNDSAD